MGFLKSFDRELEVFSAGTHPATRVNANAIKVMAEVGIDLSHNIPRDVAEFLDRSFDFVITVCDNAKESCPMFLGDVKETLHIGFDDPADATGSEEEVLAVFRRVRDEIRRDFHRFYMNLLK